MLARIALVAAGLLLVGCVGSPRSQPSGADADGFIPLFNGHDLTGWTQRGGHAVYRVEDDCIVGATRPNQPNSFLCTTSDYADFILELDFKVDPALNSGIQIRSESSPDYQNGRVHGYQVEIDPSPRAWTAGVYDEARRGWLANLDKNPDAQHAFKQNEWNHVRIECQGDHIHTWLNGVEAADLHDAMTPSGFIALQVHDVGARKDEITVRFRNLRIKPLTPPTPSASAISPSAGAPAPAGQPKSATGSAR